MAQIEIFIRTEGKREPTLHVLEEGIAVAALLSQIMGPQATAVFMFEEDSDEPLPREHRIHHGPEGRHLHHSRHRHIDVKVRYAGRTIEHAYGPGSTLARVKNWAERTLDIDAAEAASMSLQIAGTTEKPDDMVHIGSLVHGDHGHVTFDLVPTPRVQGAW